MKTTIKLFCLSILFVSGLSSKAFPQADSLKALEVYSLFSEYYKNQDYLSAEPFGWQVIEIAPKKFARYFYYKMEDVLWYMHDSADIAPEKKTEIEDTIMYFYDAAIENIEDKGLYQAHKAFIAESWLDEIPADTIIAWYEKAIEYDPELDPYYYDRLGVLYAANEAEGNDYKVKAIDLYQYLSDKEPDNPLWNDRLVGLVEDINELADIMCKRWENDRENIEKAWQCASMMMRANRWTESIIPLEFLTQKDPSIANYWNQLATAYQRTDQMNKAEDVYKKLIEIEPDNKNHYLNLGIALMDRNQFAAARTQFQKASQVGNGWGLAIFYEGLLYETAARRCGFEFEDKLVYQLAVDTYRKASSADNTATQAKERITALASSVPTQEDYFFRGYKSGQTIPIPDNECYSWVGRSITVP